LTYQSFDQKSGLKSLDIHVIVQDKYGYVWIGSDKGLSMWDSKNFTHFTVEDGLENDNVFKLYEDGQGRLWIVSFSKKLCYYSYKDKKIYNSSSVKNLEKMNVHYNTDLALKNDTLFYISDDNYSCSFNYRSNTINRFRGFSNPIIMYFFNNRLTFIEDKTYGNKKFIVIQNNMNIDSFNFFYKDYRYVYGINQKAMVFDLKNNISFQVDKSNHFFLFRKGYLNLNKSLFFNNYLIEKEFKRVDVVSEKLCFFLKENQLNCFINENIVNLKKDKGLKTIIKKEKDYYAIDNDNNLLKNNKLLKSLNQNTILYYNSQSIGSKIYFLFSKNLIEFDYIFNKILEINKVKSFESIIPISNNNIIGKHYYIKNDIRLLSTYHFLFIEKPNYFKSIIKGRTYSTFIDSKNRLWYTTLDGIFLANKFINGVVSPKKISFKETKNVFVNEYKEDAKGNMILASNIGLIIMDSNFNYTVLTDKNYLTSTDCKKVKIDPIDSSLWIVTSDGLNNIKYSFNNKKLNVKVINHFLEIDGLNSNEINDIDFEDSAIYVANKKGLNKILNRFLVPEKQEIPLHFKNLYVNEKLVDVSKPLNLKFDENSLKFEISPIYFERRERLKTSVKLYRGDEVVYSQIITNEEIDLVSLSSGDYRLELFSYDIDYPYIKSNIKKLVFVISPPFYKTWWFGLLIVAIVLGIFYYVLDKRRQSALLLAKLNRSTLNSLQNQMNPHFVFNSMQTIQNLLLDDEKDASLDYISDFSNLLRNMLEQSRNEMINLEDEIDFLKKYIKLEEIRFKNKFDVVWDIDLQEESIEEIYIPTMLIQPLIENAIKYSNAKTQNQILIRVGIENDFLIVKIENSYDSTVVRTKRHKSTAITVIKERLKLYSKNNVEGRFSLELEKEKAIATIFVPI
jgi:hypothetical protein